MSDYICTDGDWYCSGKFSLGTFGITALIAFTLTGCLSPEQALSCFSDDNVIMIGAMCIVAEGFNRTKYCRMITEAIARAAKEVWSGRWQVTY